MGSGGISPIDKFGFENMVLSLVSPIAAGLGISLELFNTENRNWDGLIVLGEFNREELEMYSSYSENLLLINNLGHEDYKYDSLMMDYASSERQLIEHFISLGKKSIGYFGGIAYRDGHILGRRRAEEFRKLLCEKGLFEERFFSLTSIRIHSPPCRRGGLAGWTGDLFLCRKWKRGLRLRYDPYHTAWTTVLRFLAATAIL
uniref:Uncharacterized protein n=1 Tax=uncultured prokaryote TaxID=198431 RepID=A0A0H5Q8P6_9ZZZZ|nr:hypothetical protein [uncultured prokaryote]